MAPLATPARRFAAKEPTSIRELQHTLRRMSASGLKVSSDYDTGACEIQFDRGGRHYVFRNASYGNPLDNLRATQLTISLLHRALEQYGTTSSAEKLGGADDPFSTFFAGFEALPDDQVLRLPAGPGEWWIVLGLSANATVSDVENAYRALAKRHHPDLGGDPEDFKRLTLAYETAKKAIMR